MKKHLVICERCGKAVDLEFNGEHYLPPKSWMTFYDDNQAAVLNIHLCPRCYKRAVEKEPQFVEAKLV